MTLVAAGPLYVPNMYFWAGSGGPSYTGVAVLLDAAADRAAAVFRAPKTGNIRKIEVRIGTVPVLTTSTLTVGLQDVSLTTGDPDGTFDQSATIATGSITANTTVKVTLGSDRAVTRGDLMAVVVQFGTFVALDQVNINSQLDWLTRSGPFQYGYPDNNTSGSYAKTTTNVSSFSIEYDDGSYAFIPSMMPVLVNGAVSYNNSSTPDAIGLRFQVPFPCKIGGCFFGLDADGDFDVYLYTSSSKTLLLSSDKDVRAGVFSVVSPFMFTAEQTLAANTTYVLSIEPSSATDVELRYFDVSAAAVLDQLEGGQAFHYATAKNPATTADFTMTTTRRPVMGLIVTAVDDGVTPATSTAPMLSGLVVA